MRFARFACLVSFVVASAACARRAPAAPEAPRTPARQFQFEQLCTDPATRGMCAPIDPDQPVRIDWRVIPAFARMG